MQPAIAISIVAMMSFVPILFPIRIADSATQLHFSPRKRALAVLITFLLLGGWLALVLWGSLSRSFPGPIRIQGVPASIPQVAYLSLGPVILGSLLIALSPTTRALLDNFQPHRVMLIQTARVIGGVFLVRYLTGDMPGVFALPAGIGDVLIGVTAPVISYLYATRGDRVRALAIGWNILGMLDLVNALTVGFLAFGLRAFPGAQATSAGQPTTFPLILIPGFGVPLTMLLHIVALRLLLRKPQAAPAMSGG